MRIKLIANPVSGGDARQKIRKAEAELKRLGADVDLIFTIGRGDARSLAAQAKTEGFDRIVVAGGDGTLNEVANGIASPEMPVAFLPLGTVNVFALETGIPTQLEQACALAVQGTPQNISLGRINGDLFLLMASVGWDAEAVASVRPRLKGMVGRLAYVVSAVETFVCKPQNAIHVITPDGDRRTGYGVVVSNCRYYGGRYVVTPNASIFRKDLEVGVLMQRGRLSMLRFALTLLLKKPLKPPFVDFMTVTSLDLQGHSVAIQVDGDAWGSLPVYIDVVPEAISMVLPGTAC